MHGEDWDWSQHVVDHIELRATPVIRDSQFSDDGAARLEELITKELGLGTAAAVLIDATIIRARLVLRADATTRTLELVGPAPLRRLHARIRLSET
jgi:hypothetical protein